MRSLLRKNWVKCVNYGLLGAPDGFLLVEFRNISHPTLENIGYA